MSWTRAAAVVLVHLDDDRLEGLADPVLEERRLDRRDDPGLVLLRLPVRPLHRLGQSRQGRIRPIRHLRPGGDGDADLTDVAIDEPPERRSRMGIGRADARVDRPGRNLVVEGRVARAAEQHGRLGEERRLRRHRRVERADHVCERALGGPVDAESLRGPAQPVDRLRIGGRQRPEDPDLRAEHQLRRGLAGHQRDLGVPALHRERRAERELVAVLALLDLLLGDRQRDPAAPLLAFLTEQADLLQQVQRVARRPVLQRALHARVVELLPAAHERLADIDLDPLAAPVDLHRPEDGRADPVGQEAAGALGQRRRIEPGVPVRRVERLAALVCLDVHRPARGDERGDVGDRVADAVALTAPLEVERLVEVHRLRWVDRDERNRRLVMVGEPRCADGALRIGEHLVRELERDLEARAQLRKRGGDLGRIGCGQADAASHGFAI